MIWHWGSEVCRADFGLNNVRKARALKLVVFILYEKGNDYIYYCEYKFKLDVNIVIQSLYRTPNCISSNILIRFEKGIFTLCWVFI